MKTTSSEYLITQSSVSTCWSPLSYSVWISMNSSNRTTFKESQPDLFADSPSKSCKLSSFRGTTVLFIAIWSPKTSCLSNPTSQASKSLTMAVAVSNSSASIHISRVDFIELLRLFSASLTQPALICGPSAVLWPNYIQAILCSPERMRQNSWLT